VLKREVRERFRRPLALLWVSADYEQATIAAVTSAFPGTRVFFVHFAHELWYSYSVFPKRPKTKETLYFDRRVVLRPSFSFRSDSMAEAAGGRPKWGIYKTEENESLRRDFHSLISLAFAPENDAQETFHQLFESLEDDSLRPVFDHVKDHYIKGSPTYYVTPWRGGGGRRNVSVCDGEEGGGQPAVT